MAYNPAKTTIKSKVLPFTPENFADALSNEHSTSSNSLRQKTQFRFFCAYLGPHPDGDGLTAQTILIEEPYVSHSYLLDYADYYVRGFSEYARLCKRIHFFAESFDQTTFDQALTDREQHHQLWNSYLGYIVSKPLPGTPIGATLLKSYPSTSTKCRHYPAQRPYSVNVLGQQLSIDTLIFQEQDTNVAACATVALWVAFHKTAYLFQTPLPSLYQITASTGSPYTQRGRSFPSTSLNRQQIGKAVEKVGLVLEDFECLSVDALQARAREAAQAELLSQDEQWALSLKAGNPDPEFAPGGRQSEAELTHCYLNDLMLEQLGQAKGFIYAYLRLGLPVLLFLHIIDVTRTRHLVTVTGYREAAHINPPSASTDSMLLLSTNIERFYAHDDQIGPYARLGFTSDGYWETSWPQADNPKQKRQASVERISVPLIRDIRIHYDQVYNQIVPLDAVFAQLLRINQGIVWDIYLAYSNHYKQELLDNPPAPPAHLRRITSRLLPKYIWVARATLNGTSSLVADIVFDATDLHTGFYCLLTNIYGQSRTALQRIFSIPGNYEDIHRLYYSYERYTDLLLRYTDLLLHDLQD